MYLFMLVGFTQLHLFSKDVTINVSKFYSSQNLEETIP